MFRPIYEPRTRAREYCDLAVNIYSGCNHGCVYCYAPGVLRLTKEAFMQVSPRKDITESVKRQISREGLRGKKIMLCFTCDPYPAGIDTAVTREVIKAIKDGGNNVQILTKGGKRAERDFDLLGAGDSFGVTLSCNPVQQKEIEPNAAPILERLETLQHARDAGIKTWASFEPVFDPEIVYEAITRWGFIDLFRIGKLNHARSSINWAAFGVECQRLCIEHNRDYYIKDDLWAEMKNLNYGA